MNITEKLNSIRETKEAIKTSIRNKGVELEDTAPFDTYSSKIDEITTKVETENVEITPTKEEQIINRSEDKYIESVKVNPIPDEYIIPSGNLDITENGSYDVKDKESVNVEVVSSGGIDLNDYFETTYQNRDADGAQYWLEKFWIKKPIPLALNIPNNVISLTNFARTYKSKYMPKIIFGNNVTNIGQMYYEAVLVETIDTTGWNTENVTEMGGLFRSCQKLNQIIGLEKLNTSKVTSMGSMFYANHGLSKLDLSTFDTSKVLNMSYMFYDVYKIITIGPSEEYDLNIKNFDTSNVTNMSNMFALGSGTSFQNDTTKTINLSHFDTSNVTNMSSMFAYQTDLTTLDLSNWNTSKVTNISNMFDQLDSLVTLNIGHFDFGAVTSNSNMFRKKFNASLTNLTFGYDLGKSYTRTSNNYSNYTLELNAQTSLSHDSLMDVINKLYDLNLTYNVANGGKLYTQSLVLGATNKAKLTEEEMAIATAKGWVIS